MAPDQYLKPEPPTGSVVAIDWGEPRQEVWVSNKANIGNWYTTDTPWDSQHPDWYDVLRRAEGRTMTLLVPGDRDAYAAGFDAGVASVGEAVGNAVEEMRLYVNGRHPEVAGDGPHAH